MATTRHVEIDLLRTIAIIMMVAYHGVFDLRVFYGWNIDLDGTAWETVRIATASLFLLVAGISSQFSTRPLRRALIVLGCAVLVTIVTYLFDPMTFIRFGILHCIGTGMLLMIPLKKLHEWNILLGILVSFQFFIFNFQFPFPHTTLDYYPLIPWFGVMLIGTGIGHFLYKRNHLDLSLTLPPLLTFPGRHALLLYMVHQPVLLSILHLVRSA